MTKQNTVPTDQLTDGTEHDGTLQAEKGLG